MTMPHKGRLLYHTAPVFMYRPMHHETRQFPPLPAAAAAPAPPPVFESLVSPVAFLPQPGLCIPVKLPDPQECGDFGLFAVAAATAAAAAAEAATSTAPAGALAARSGGFEAAAASAARALNFPPIRPAMSYADPTALRVWKGGMEGGEKRNLKNAPQFQVMNYVGHRPKRELQRTGLCMNVDKALWPPET